MGGRLLAAAVLAAGLPVGLLGDHPQPEAPAYLPRDTFLAIGDVNAVGVSTQAEVDCVVPGGSPAYVGRVWNAGPAAWQECDDPVHESDANEDASWVPSMANAWMAKGRGFQLVAAADSTSTLVGSGAGAWDPRTGSAWSDALADVAAAVGSCDDVTAVLLVAGNNDTAQPYAAVHEALEALVDRIALDCPGVPVLLSVLTSKWHTTGARSGVDGAWVTVARAQQAVIASRSHVHLGPSQGGGLTYESAGAFQDEGIFDVAAYGARWAETAWAVLHGRVFYVDAAGGSASNTGRSPSDAWDAPTGTTPWTHPANTVPEAGDAVFWIGDQAATAATIVPQNTGVFGGFLTHQGLYTGTRPVLENATGLRPVMLTIAGQQWVAVRDLELQTPGDRGVDWISVNDGTVNTLKGFFALEDLRLAGGDGSDGSDPIVLYQHDGSGDELADYGEVNTVWMRRLELDPAPIAGVGGVDLVREGPKGRFFLLEDSSATDAGHNGFYFRGGGPHLVSGGTWRNSSRPAEFSQFNGTPVPNPLVGSVVERATFIRGTETVFDTGSLQAVGPGGVLFRWIELRCLADDVCKAGLRVSTNTNQVDGTVSGNRFAHLTAYQTGGGGTLPETEGGLSFSINEAGRSEGDNAIKNSVLVDPRGAGIPLFLTDGGDGTWGSPAGAIEGNVLWRGSAGQEVVEVVGEASCTGSGDADRCTLAEFEAAFAEAQNNLEADPGFAAPGTPGADDLTPCAVLDQGVFLTTVASETSQQGRTLQVADSGWLRDGLYNAEWGLELRPGDQVQLDGGESARVLWVDFATDTLWLDTVLSFGPGGVETGDGVAYAFAGSAPDPGAIEHAGSTCP